MPRLVSIAVVFALLAVPALAQGQAPAPPALDGGAFGSLEPSIPSPASEEAPVAPTMPVPPVPAEPDNGPLSLSESMVFLLIEGLLLVAIGVAIAREGRERQPQRRPRHARRSRASTRTRGAAHSAARRKAPPPSPRRRRTKASRAGTRAKAGRR